MKRFYERAEAAAREGGHHILLDGRPVRTPGGNPLALPSAALAAAIAGEWGEQKGTVRPATMPLMRLATTVIDLMPARRADAIAEITGFARSDLLCYRVGHPRELVARQQQRWQPWLEWAAQSFGARLRVTAVLSPVEQPAEAVRALTGVLQRLDDWRLVGLHAATRLTGSLVLGLAIEHALLTAEQAFELAHLEEFWEIEQWGADPEQQARQQAVRRDLEAACRFLELLAA